MNKNIETSKKGFTLLELLIVITIISVLSVILIVALNPAETLRKARDTQRLSDLSSLKTAIGIYVTSETQISLDGPYVGDGTDNDLCINGDGTQSMWVSDSDVTDTQLSGTSFAAVDPASDTAAAAIDGSGWVPVDLAEITGGSPISNMPLDPTNDCAVGGSTCADVTNEALIYRYACDATNLTFEFAATLESISFLTDDPKDEKDGGNDLNAYEVGTDLSLIPDSDTY